ncbi:leucine-rich repeat-containing protein 66 [Pteronotus mesoamericanus]|uniref:leucine-rich repeat-containing protein 66 n=1 Tax=Pteronotus mesoamericanus TaxID=1884717 RepID=UPI0023EB532C|nr:leucine-rich repeat-containing protein 66 [Pteronotus parnellii mesoamericanus]
MKNLCFRVIVMAIGLYCTGAMTNPSRKNSIFFNAACQWDRYLLINCSFTGKLGIPSDISQTAATVDASSGFFRVLRQSPTENEEQNIKHLDLSNNLILTITLSSLAHLHALEILNLSHNAIHSISVDLPSPKSSWVKCHRSSCGNGLPYLKLLILQRNKLSDVPKGLWKLKSLQSLDLSFNGISQIGVSDFHNCLRLENLYLRSNKIFRIHPEAFKDLKKLQVVDLRSNALTAILPMMIIALELPRLDADLADNQWQCDASVAVFQNFISKPWRRKWDEICNKSIGSEEASRQPPRSSVSREIQLPHTNLNHLKSLRRHKVVRPREGTYRHFPILENKGHASSDTREQQRRLPRWVRSTQDGQTAGGKGATSADLTLAICLSVFITFLVAFCLGAFTRPYVDRLWQWRCRKKKPSSDLVYCNEGYNEMEAAGNIQRPRVDLHHVCHGLNLCENQDPFSGTEATPQAAVIADRSLGMSRKEPGSRQSREHGKDGTGAGRRKENRLTNGGTACSVTRGPPSADSYALISAEQDHICRNDILRKINYESEAQEESLGQYSLRVPVIAGRLQTGSGSIHQGLNELDPPLTRYMTGALSKTQAHMEAQRTGENEERARTEQLPLKFSNEMQASASINLLSTRGQSLKGAKAEEEHFTYYCSATLSDLADMDPSPSVSPPRWGNDPHVTPANEEPVQKHAPWDTQHELDIDYDSDSDGGSLFTLSSTSSGDARCGTEEEADGEESCRASEDEDSGVRKDNVTPCESLEDNIAFQKSQEKCETQEDLFEKPLISSSDSDLYKSHLGSASNTNTLENPLTLPRSLGNSPSRDKIPDAFTYDYASAPQSEATKWHYSLTDLEFPSVDTLPQTPPCSAEVPSDPDKTACRERDLDNCTYEPFIQETDTDPNNIPLHIPSGENLRPSQDSEEGNAHSNPLDTDTNEDHGFREVISQTQLLPFCGDEPDLQYERGGGE